MEENKRGEFAVRGFWSVGFNGDFATVVCGKARPGDVHTAVYGIRLGDAVIKRRFFGNDLCASFRNEAGKKVGQRLTSPSAGRIGVLRLVRTVSSCYLNCGFAA
jgi:hypothetical protein